MKKRFYLALILAVSLIVLPISGCRPSGDAKPPKVEIYTFPPRSDSPPQTPSPGQPPAVQPPPAEKQPQDYVERRIVVDQRNSVFSIGLPANTREETEVIAEKPIDFWFEYLPNEVQLEVDGMPVQRSMRWELKLRYTTGVTRFKYVVINATPTFYSYNLHLMPTKTEGSIPVVVRQHWSQP